MRRVVLTLVVSLASPLLFAGAGAQIVKTTSPPATKSPVPVPSLPLPKSVPMIDGTPATIDQIPFGHGETLTYNASWMGMAVGNATMKVESGATFEGKPAIHISGSAKSSRSFSMFFSIKDAAESWVDPDELYSLGFVSDQSEGSNQDYQKWILDYEKGVAHRYRVNRKKDGAIQKYDVDFPLTKSKVQDAASMLYFYRAFDLKVGQTLTSDVYVSKDMWTLEVAVVGAEKGVKVKAGKFDCLKVEPRVLKNGKAQNKGKMTVWVSNDEHRVPVKIVSEVSLGKISAELVSYTQGVKDPEPKDTK